MNLKEIKEMIKLMNENDLTEIELEREGTKIRLKKASMDETGIRSHPQVVHAPPVPVTATQIEPPSPLSIKPTIEIVSPMVGTFYSAPSPEAPPFVEVGQIVEVGQVVCIVEAMKLMNEIKSEVKGRVVEVTVENVEPVEFGQTLFVLEPL